MVRAISNGGNLGFEKILWNTADKLRGDIDASEYKEVILGLIFLRFSEGIKDVFNVPTEASWKSLIEDLNPDNAARLIDHAMDLIEKQNIQLKNILPKNYSTIGISNKKLLELIRLIDQIKPENNKNNNDILGRVYEYFLGQFAASEGRNGGEFYTPQSVVKLLVGMLEPFNGKIFDPCCGSGGMFVQSEKFITAHGGKMDNLTIYGQESNQKTWKLCKMNLSVRGINSKIEKGDSFLNDLHKDLKADYIIANPPFNMSDWGLDSLMNDTRWEYGIPQKGNANFAWVQHFIHHLSDKGVAGFVLSNGSLSSNSTEGEIRRKLIELDLIDCIVALPPQLFYNTPIPACLWFISKKKKLDKNKREKSSLYRCQENRADDRQKT